MPKALDIPVFNYAKVGAEREAAARGNIDVIWRAPESADQLRQKEILESFITQKVDGIAISCLNGDFLTDTINRAIDAGIPVTTWDADAPKSKRLAFYGVDDLAAGRILAEQAVDAARRKGQGRHHHERRRHEPAAPARRREGGAGAAHGACRWSRCTTSRRIPCTAPRSSRPGTNRYPDLAAWISVGGWPVFTRNALAAVPAHTKVISFDTIPPAPDLLKAGKVQVLLGPEVFRLGQRVGAPACGHQGRKDARRTRSSIQASTS